MASVGEIRLILSRLKQMQLPGVGDSLGAAGGVQLLQDVMQMGFDCAQGDGQRPGDFAVGQALGYQIQDF